MAATANRITGQDMLCCGWSAAKDGFG